MSVPPVALGGTCGLFIDVQPDEAVRVGDWVATEAGSRYLVIASRPVHRRTHAQQSRYALRCARLAKHIDPPGDVVTWWIHWYPRARSRR